MSDQELKTVLPFGSCRIFDPLKHLAKDGKILRGWNRSYWYNHSAAEMVQRHKILSGELVVPSHLTHLVFEERFDEKTAYTARGYGPAYLNQFDYFVVEVTTAKTFVKDGVRLQYYLIQKEADRLGIQRHILSRLLRTPIDERQSFVAQNPEVSPAFEMFKDVLELRQTPDEIGADLSEFKSRVNGSMLLIGHINIPIENGTHIPERVALNKTLQSWAHVNAVPYFDPSMFADDGIDRAFKDISHYNDEFIPTVASRLLSFF